MKQQAATQNRLRWHFDPFKNFRRKAPMEVIIHIAVAILFMAVALSYLYIFFWAVMAAVRTHTEIVMEPFALPVEWHWEHFAEVFEKLTLSNGADFWDMLFNSLYFSVCAVGLQQFTTVTFAYCCTKYKFPGSSLVYPIIIVMITLPLYGTSGAMYEVLKAFGMIDSYTHIFVSASGFSATYLYYAAYFKNLSWTYAEAAMIDGANDFQIYLKVMFPQALPIFSALYLTGWLGVWNSYDSALIYLPNLPTLPVGIYQFNTEMIYRARLDILFAACVIISIPAIILFVAFNKLITSNVSLGGIKG
ncbi:MAG: carbohydrate ABC transporter permease [Clostridia bacterium]|nr:carbohydrate ABC transporter permease [Clostridia bacterium]